jgi:hypothetical protein
MPLRIPTQTIILHRKGQRVVVKPAKDGRTAVPFDFTTDEIEDITASSPTALRKPINEEANVQVAAKEPKQPKGRVTETPPAGDKTDDL